MVFALCISAVQRGVVELVVVVVIHVHVDVFVVLGPGIVRRRMIAIGRAISRVNGAVRRWIVGTAGIINAPISPRGVWIVVVAVYRRTDCHANAEREKPDSDRGTSADSGLHLRSRVAGCVTTTVAGAGVL